MGGLNWIVKSSRLQFKSVCKFWRSLIQSTLITDFYTATTANTNTNFKSSSSSSSKFGTFLFHVSGPLLIHVSGPRGYFQVLHESTILMLSPGSESEFQESRSVSSSHSRSGGWCWSTESTDIDGFCDKSITWRPADNYAQKGSKSGKYEDDYYDEEKVFKVLSSNDDQHQHQHEMVFKLDNLGIPSCYKIYKDPKYIVGSCNGLICLFDREHMDVSLWNPATTQFRILPKWLTTENGGEELRLVGSPCLVALGFDVETKDYKVVVVNWSSPRPLFGQRQECVCQVQVYSLSTDSWRLLEDIDALPGTPVNHHYHCQDYDIWVLNEHEHSSSNVNKESWTKLHSFQTTTEGERTVPIGISNDGEFALLELQGRDGLSTKMQLYNLVTKEAKKDFLYCSAVWSKAIVYKPSQVPIIGGKMM